MPNTRYKVWIEIEAVNESEDTYETLDGYSLAIFDTEQAAYDYVSGIADQHYEPLTESTATESEVPTKRALNGSLSIGLLNRILKLHIEANNVESSRQFARYLARLYFTANAKG